MVRIQLRVLGESVAVEAPQPPPWARLDELLPVIRAVDDAAVGAAVRRAEAAGTAISCRKGCSTCCRAQPVPVTPPEAYALSQLVDSLPEPRRTEIRERFADRVQRLYDAGLVEQFLDRSGSDPDDDTARGVVDRYFRLGLVCPFLEDDACSIYADRPFVCRQYLVTSDPDLCADPLHNPVKVLPIPIAAAGATLRIGEQVLNERMQTVPLVLALIYVQAHKAMLERHVDSADVGRQWIQELSMSARE